MNDKKIRVAVALRYNANSGAVSVGTANLDAIMRQGGEPVLVATEQQAAEAAEVCDGLLLPGGGDFEPERYGEHETVEIDRRSAPRNDALDLLLIRLFSEKGKPILGICRGHQAINIAFGGSLIQHIPLHRLGKEVFHNVTLEKSSALALAFDKTVIPVNSTHHQAVRRIANGFSVAAAADDGTVEAIERGNILGVQWHPEAMGDDTVFRLFFSRMRENG